MRVEDVLNLVNAGFTKTEIIAMAAEPEKAPENTTKQTKEPEIAPEQPVVNNQQPVQANIPALDETIAKLNATITQLQQQAVLNSQQPEKLSTDDILAQIINPPRSQK